MPFIVVPFTTDPEVLADEALDRLAAAWEGWEGSDGDMEVIQIETLAPMASEMAEVAATVPSAIFRNYGQSLLGIPYNSALAAVGTATFTSLDTTGYTTSAPVEIALGGWAFMTDTPVVITAGQTQVDVDITAIESGAGGNGQWGFAELMSPLPWISSVEVESPTAGGADAETDDAYQNRLADRLLLQTTTLVTGRDFELMAMQVEGVGRAMAMVNTARAVTVALADPNGEIVSAPIKAIVLDLFDDYRQVNTTYSVIDPTYTTITVTFAVVVVPGYDPTAIRDQCIAAVLEWLSPANWGRPRQATDDPSTLWLNDTIVRYSELIRTLGIAGVRYVQSATLNGGTADLALSGTAPLTRCPPGNVTGSAS